MAIRTTRFGNLYEANYLLNGGVIGGLSLAKGIWGLDGKTLVFTSPIAGTVTFSAPGGLLMAPDIMNQIEAQTVGLKARLVDNRLALIEENPSKGVAIDSSSTALTLLGFSGASSAVGTKVSTDGLYNFSGIGGGFAFAYLDPAFDPAGLGSAGSLVAWVEADFDTSEMTVVGNEVTSVNNRGSIGGTFPRYVVGPYLSELQGKTSFDYDFSRRPILLSDQPASAWKQLHQTGTIVAVVNRASTSDAGGYQFLVSTAWNGIGVHLSLQEAGNRIFFKVNDGTGVIVSIISPVSSLPEAETFVIVVRYDPAQPTEAEIFIDGVSAGTATFTGTPSTADPEDPLHLGARYVERDNNLDGSLPLVLVYDEYLDDAAVQALSNHYVAKYKRTSNLQASGPLAVYWADYGLTVQQTGSNYYAIELADQSPHGWDARQTNVTLQPQVIDGDNLSLRFDEVDDHLIVGGPGIKSTYSCIFALPFKAGYNRGIWSNRWGISVGPTETGCFVSFHIGQAVRCWMSHASDTTVEIGIHPPEGTMVWVMLRVDDTTGDKELSFINEWKLETGVTRMQTNVPGDTASGEIGRLGYDNGGAAAGTGIDWHFGAFWDKWLSNDDVALVLDELHDHYTNMEWSPFAIPRLNSYIRAEEAGDDGSGLCSNLVENAPGFGTANYNQVTASLRPRIITSSGYTALKGDTTNRYLTSLRPASDWVFLHTEATMLIVVEPVLEEKRPYVIETGNDANPANVGTTVILDCRAAVQAIQVYLCNGSGTRVFTVSSGTATVTEARPYLLSVRYSAAAGAEIFVDGVSKSTTPYVGSPSAAAPYQTATIGRTGRDIGPLFEWNIYKRRLSDTELAIAHKRLAAKYGITL